MQSFAFGAAWFGNRRRQNMRRHQARQTWNILNPVAA
jgi:hypothetical protein